jgi:hypothetical protein
MNEREWNGGNDQTTPSHDQIFQLQQHHLPLQHLNNNVTSPTLSSTSSLIDEYGGSTSHPIDHGSSSSSSGLQEIYNLQSKARSLPLLDGVSENENNPHGMESNTRAKSASWASSHDEINYPAYNPAPSSFDPSQQPLQYAQQQQPGLSNQQQQVYSPRGPWHQTPLQPPKSPSLLFTVCHLLSPISFSLSLLF